MKPGWRQVREWDKKDLTAYVKVPFNIPKKIWPFLFKKKINKSLHCIFTVFYFRTGNTGGDFSFPEHAPFLPQVCIWPEWRRMLCFRVQADIESLHSLMLQGVLILAGPLSAGSLSALTELSRHRGRSLWFDFVANNPWGRERAPPQHILRAVPLSQSSSFC